jgi:MFS family permease
MTTDAEAVPPKSLDPAGIAASAMRTPSFRWLTVSWVLTNLADSLLMLLMAVWVKDLTGSNVAAGLTFALFGVPALFAPVLGHVADRVSRLGMMKVTYAIGAVVLVPLFAGRGAGDVWLLYLVTCVYAAIGYSTAAAQAGLLRDMLPDDAIGPANGRLTVIDMGFRVVLPVLGAAVYATVGIFPLIGVAIAGFVGAIAALAAVRVAETPPVPKAELQPLRTELAAGFAHLAHTPPLGRQSIALTITFGATGLLNAIVFAILDALGVPAEYLGPLLVGQGLAGALGAALAPRVMRRWGRGPTLAVGLAALGIGQVPLTGSVIWLGVAGMALCGFGVSLAVVSFVTERQLRTPATLQGRVASAANVLLNLPSVALTVAGAWLLGVIDYRLLIVISILAALACVPLVLRKAPEPEPTPEIASDAATAP